MPRTAVSAAAWHDPAGVAFGGVRMRVATFRTMAPRQSASEPGLARLYSNAAVKWPRRIPVERITDGSSRLRDGLWAGNGLSVDWRTLVAGSV